MVGVDSLQIILIRLENYQIYYFIWTNDLYIFHQYISLTKWNARKEKMCDEILLCLNELYAFVVRLSNYLKAELTKFS